MTILNSAPEIDKHTLNVKASGCLEASILVACWYINKWLGPLLRAQGKRAIHCQVLEEYIEYSHSEHRSSQATKLGAVHDEVL